jgi:hypothetical protein
VTIKFSKTTLHCTVSSLVMGDNIRMDLPRISCHGWVNVMDRLEQLKNWLLCGNVCSEDTSDSLELGPNGQIFRCRGCSSWLHPAGVFFFFGGGGRDMATRRMTYVDVDRGVVNRHTYIQTDRQTDRPLPGLYTDWPANWLAKQLIN